ncbi:MAG: hypothetical protein HY661_03550 [Betaproteobacteria bacterium]|nr:hypothetical protein [Betaproteobacteria bacterium]
MRTAGRALLAGVVVLASSLVSGCGERAQVVDYTSGKYQGKTDTRPWENDPGAARYTTSKWTPGNKTSWEEAIRVRNQGQNEYGRVQ